MKSTIITIGDELLIGQVIDTNSAFIAQKLGEIGIAIHRRIAISDNTNEIKKCIIESWETSDIIITTGGLGPTKDDITKKTIADLFQVGMKRDEKTFNHVKDFFESRNRPFLEVNKAQADIPENAEVLFNARGTAPGMWIEHQGKILISLPGVPFEMEYLITTHVIEKLKNQYAIPALYYAYIQTFGIGESFLAERIQHIEDKLPEDIKLAYLPSPMSVLLRLSGNEKQSEIIEKYANQIREKLHDAVYGNSNKPIVEMVFEKLNSQNKTVTLLESCTGGYLSDNITNISGSSKVYKGGWNVYTNNFKHNELNISNELLETYSAVSQECAEALLRSALDKTNADFGISVVGYLEKSDGIKPIAYICYGSKERKINKTIDLFYPRVKSKEAIAKMAWVSLYKDFLN